MEVVGSSMWSGVGGCCTTGTDDRDAAAVHCPDEVEFSKRFDGRGFFKAQYFSDNENH